MYGVIIASSKEAYTCMASSGLVTEHSLCAGEGSCNYVAVSIYTYVPHKVRILVKVTNACNKGVNVCAYF